MMPCRPLFCSSKPNSTDPLTSTSPSPQVPKHSNYNRLLALSAHAWHVDVLLAELETLTPDDIASFTSDLLAR